MGKLFEFAFCQGYDSKIAYLASLCPEKWSFGTSSDNVILKNMIIKLSQNKREAPDFLAPLVKNLSDRHNSLRSLAVCLCKGGCPVRMYLAMSRVAHREGYPEIGFY